MCCAKQSNEKVRWSNKGIYWRKPERTTGTGERTVRRHAKGEKLVSECYNDGYMGAKRRGKKEGQKGKKKEGKKREKMYRKD